MSDKGHIELERQIDSITVGVRHRKDLGDMNALMRSIEEVGLLQPVTVTPDGALVCDWKVVDLLADDGLVVEIRDAAPKVARRTHA